MVNPRLIVGIVAMGLVASPALAFKANNTEHWNANSWNANAWNANAWNANAWNANSWNANSWNANAWNANAWNANSWNANAWNANSWNANSWNANAWNANAWNANSWNANAWNANAWNSQHWNANSWNANAWNANSWNANAWNANAWNANSWNANAWNANAWNANAWNSEFYNAQALAFQFFGQTRPTAFAPLHDSALTKTISDFLGLAEIDGSRVHEIMWDALNPSPSAATPLVLYNKPFGAPGRYALAHFLSDGTIDPAYAPIADANVRVEFPNYTVTVPSDRTALELTDTILPVAGATPTRMTGPGLTGVVFTQKFDLYDELSTDWSLSLEQRYALVGADVERLLFIGAHRTGRYETSARGLDNGDIDYYEIYSLVFDENDTPRLIRLFATNPDNAGEELSFFLNKRYGTNNPTETTPADFGDGITIVSRSKGSALGKLAWIFGYRGYTRLVGEGSTYTDAAPLGPVAERSILTPALRALTLAAPVFIGGHDFGVQPLTLTGTRVEIADLAGVVPPSSSSSRAPGSYWAYEGCFSKLGAENLTTLRRPAADVWNDLNTRFVPAGDTTGGATIEVPANRQYPFPLDYAPAYSQGGAVLCAAGYNMLTGQFITEHQGYMVTGAPAWCAATNPDATPDEAAIPVNATCSHAVADVCAMDPSCCGPGTLWHAGCATMLAQMQHTEAYRTYVYDTFNDSTRAGEGAVGGAVVMVTTNRVRPGAPIALSLSGEVGLMVDPAFEPTPPWVGGNPFDLSAPVPEVFRNDVHINIVAGERFTGSETIVYSVPYTEADQATVSPLNFRMTKTLTANLAPGRYYISLTNSAGQPVDLSGSRPGRDGWDSWDTRSKAFTVVASNPTMTVPAVVAAGVPVMVSVAGMSISPGNYITLEQAGVEVQRIYLNTGTSTQGEDFSPAEASYLAAPLAPGEYFARLHSVDDSQVEQSGDAVPITAIATLATSRPSYGITEQVPIAFAGLAQSDGACAEDFLGIFSAADVAALHVGDEFYSGFWSQAITWKYLDDAGGCARMPAGTLTFAPGTGGGNLVAVAMSSKAGAYSVTAMTSYYVTPPPAPSAPVSVTATAQSTQVTLAWATTPGARTYNVLRSTTSGSGYVSVATGLTATGFVDVELVNGTTYYYVVIASNFGGDSPASAQVSARPMPPMPATPTGLVATAGNAKVTLSWAAASNATTYTVKRGPTGGPYTTAGCTATAPTTTCTVTGLTNGTAYFFAVTATNITGTSAASTQASATPIAPPAAPTGLAGVSQFGQATLTWSATAGATSYVLKRGTTQVGGVLTATRFVDTGLTNGTSYAYTIAAVNAGGTSAASTAVSVTPAQGIDRIPLASAPTGSSTTAGFPASAAKDANLTTSWEPAAASYANATWTIDLGAAYGVTSKSTNQITIQVKCATANSGVSLAVSTDNATYSTPVPIACTTTSTSFTKTINVVGGRYVRVKNTSTATKIDLYEIKAFTN